MEKNKKKNIKKIIKKIEIKKKYIYILEKRRNIKKNK